MEILQFPPEIFKVIDPKAFGICRTATFSSYFLWSWFTGLALHYFWNFTVVVHLFPVCNFEGLLIDAYWDNLETAVARKEWSVKYPLIPALYTAIIVSFHDGIEFVVTQRDSRKPANIIGYESSQLWGGIVWVGNVRGYETSEFSSSKKHYLEIL